MPMYQIEQEMSYRELLNWVEYFKRRPSGWQDDLRTSYLIQSFGSKAKGDEIFPSLKIIYDEAKANEEFRIKKAKKNPFIQRFMMPHLEEKENGE